MLCQLGPLFGPCDGGIAGVQALRHLFTDDVDQTLEGLLHVDVILGAGLEELKTCRGLVRCENKGKAVTGQHASAQRRRP